MTSLVDQVVAIAEALTEHEVPWAFGGAFALAYATLEPRGTRDIDVNVFVPATQAAAVFASLPRGVRHTKADIVAARSDEQIRLFWGDTPVDIFFAADDFHHEVAKRCLTTHFAGHNVRVLSPEDLAVFKALFDRGKDWVDIAAMVEANSVDLDVAANRLERLIGDDSRVARLRSITP